MRSMLARPLLALAVLAAPAAAQTVTGVVRDLAGGRVEGAFVVAVPAELAGEADPLGRLVAERAEPRMHLEPLAVTDSGGWFQLGLAPDRAWALVATRYVDGFPFLLRPLQPWVSSAPRVLAPGEAEVELALPLARVELEPAGLGAGGEVEGRLVCRERWRGALYEDWGWRSSSVSRPDLARRVHHARPGSTLVCAWVADDGRRDLRVVQVGAGAKPVRVPLELPPRTGEALIVASHASARPRTERFRLSVHDPDTGLALVAREGDWRGASAWLAPGRYLVRFGPVERESYWCTVSDSALEPLPLASAQRVVELRDGHTLEWEPELAAGGLVRLELVPPAGGEHPVLARWRAGELSAAEASFLVTYGELPAGIVRVEDPDGAPSPPLAWYRVFDGLPIPGPPVAGLAPGLPPATSHDRLPPGRHVLRVDVPGFAPARVAVQVGVDTVTDARVVLETLEEGARER